MSIPKTVYDPPFNVTRASHSVLTVKDLSVSRNFYVDLIGFIVSDEDKDTIYLRVVAEACHHSLVLKRARGEPQAERVGMRVFTEEDLEKAKAFFEKAGLPAQWVQVPHQGRTLHVTDASGAPIEFCATMELKPRLVVAFEHHRGAVPQRLDHFQLLVPDVQKACEFWMSMGFRLSEYISPDGTKDLLFVFLQRKGNPHVIVYARGQDRGCITPPSVSRSPITSSMSATLRPRWDLPPTSNSVPAATVPATPSSSTCATRTDIASSCSTPTTR
jgi:catechol 2,3-dioxygenase